MKSSALKLRNFIAANEWQQGILMILNFLQLHSLLSMFTTKFFPLNVCVT